MAPRLSLLSLTVYLPNGQQTRITLHLLGNIKEIPESMAPRLSSLLLAVFGPNTSKNFSYMED